MHEADPSAAPDEAARASQLREEIAILERAMGHRRAGDLEGARAAIAEHARRFPRGLLAPERDRLASELE
jgi:TolA-binding protein